MTERICLYVDSCIWLNLFKKEGNPLKGKPYWQIAEEFIDLINFHTHRFQIVYTNHVLTELKYNLYSLQNYEEKKQYLEKKQNFLKLRTNSKNYDLARKIEDETDFTLSFYDYMHIAICIHNDCILITRDKELIKVGTRYVRVLRPEDFLLEFF